MIDQLITALSKEVELSAEEIADTIWLALQMQEFQAEPVSSGFLLKKEDEREINKQESQPDKGTSLPSEPKTTDSEETAATQPPEEQKTNIYPQTQQKTSKSSNSSFKVPDAPSLRDPLTLARALKPLMRRISSGRKLILDEAATTQRIADEGLWIPVLKPTVEPWLDLELVVDEAISMQIWRHTIRELERLLKNYGIFRDVRVWGLIKDENEQVQIRRGTGATARNQTPRSPKELIDPSGRHLVLVVSDCVSSLWRNGEVTPVLELWAKQGSMAIVQMLPKWLWKRTALGRASEVRLRGLTPGLSNQKLIAKEVSLWDELEEETGVKVPVFTLEPDKVATWAQMLSGKGSIWTLGYVFKLDVTPVNKESGLFNLTHSELSAEQRVQAFRVTASPTARKLAGLLASAPVISLPIVRLIRETLLKDSQQVHVAEVFLGGLLKPLSEINVDTNPDYVQYEFIEGVRELLVDSVPSKYVFNVVDEVSKYVAKKAGLSLEDVAAILRNPQQLGDSEIDKEVGRFATVTAQVLKRLGGESLRLVDEPEDEDIEYVLNLPYHLSMAGMADELCELLIEFDFIEHKISASAPQSLIADYDFIFVSEIEISEHKKDSLRLIQGAIRMSAHLLNEPDNKTQLAGHLLARLLSFQTPEIQALLEQAKHEKNYPWLRPLTASLTPPGGALVCTLTGHTHYVTAIAITPDGQTVISASNDNTLKVWDLTTNTLRHTLRGHTDRVLALAMTPDGHFAVSGSKDKTLKLWDIANGIEIKTLIGHTSFVHSVAIASDGQWIISGSWGIGNALKLWDLVENKHYTLADNLRVNGIAMTPDGQVAISGLNDNTLILWDCSGIPLHRLTGHTGAIDAVAMTPDGRLALSGSKDTTLKLWDLTNGTELKTFAGHTKAINAVAITPDGRLAISGSADHTLKVWDLVNGEEINTFTEHTNWVKAVALTPDGKLAVSGSADQTIKIWDLTNSSKQAGEAGHANWVRTVAIAPSGKFAISGSADHTLKIWDLATGKELDTLKGHTNWVRTVAISPDGRIAISGSIDKTLKLWDLASGKECGTLIGHTSTVNAVAIAPDGRTAVSGSFDDTLKVWDLTTCSELYTFTGHSGDIWAVAMTPDGQKVVSASSDKTLKLWDLASSAEILTFTGHTDYVTAVAITPNGQTIISGSVDRTLKLWNLASGTELCTLVGHKDYINAIAVTPDGRKAISAGYDNALKVWDLESRQEITSFIGDSAMFCCAVAPDGVTIVAGEASGRLHFMRFENNIEANISKNTKNYVKIN